MKTSDDKKNTELTLKEIFNPLATKNSLEQFDVRKLGVPHHVGVHNKIGYRGKYNQKCRTGHPIIGNEIVGF